MIKFYIHWRGCWKEISVEEEGSYDLYYSEPSEECFHSYWQEDEEIYWEIIKGLEGEYHESLYSWDTQTVQLSYDGVSIPVWEKVYTDLT